MDISYPATLVNEDNDLRALRRRSILADISERCRALSEFLQCAPMHSCMTVGEHAVVTRALERTSVIYMLGWHLRPRDVTHCVVLGNEQDEW